MKKYIFCIMLFVSFTLSLFGTEIFVDGDNTQGPWLGTELNPYQYIHVAITNANDDDIITVHEGDYEENLVINNKNLTLRSSDWDSEIRNPELFTIDGGGNYDVIDINNCDSFTINGFSIVNSGSFELDCGLDIDETNNLTISYCIFDDNRYAIDLSECNQVIISNNEGYVYNDDDYIIKGDYVSNFSFDNNNFWGSISTQSSCEGDGIVLTRSQDGEIINSTFTDFETTIHFDLPIWPVVKSENITIEGNDFYNSNNTASSNVDIIAVWTADKLKIIGNKFHYSNQGPYNRFIYISHSLVGENYVLIKDNLFENNYISIALHGSVTQHSKVDIINNTFIGYNGVTNYEKVIDLFGLNQLNLFKNNIIYDALEDFDVPTGYNTTYLTPTISYNSLGDNDIFSQYPSWNGGDNIYINPDLTPDYHLSEDSILLIDHADPDTNGNGVDWQYDEDDRDIDGSRKDMGCYPYLHDYDTKVFTKGVHWVSFPVLTSDGTYEPDPPNNIPSIPPIDYELYQQAYEVNNTAGLLQDETGAGTIDEFIEILGNRYGTPMKIRPQGAEFGLYDEDFENMLFRHEGYKIDIGSTTDPTELKVGNGVGDERLSVNYEISGSMVTDEYHWIGYWIPRTQNIVDAFGELWQSVVKVKSEDWFYSPAIIQRGEEPDPIYPIALSAEHLTLEYGKAYLVLFNEQIEDFRWTDSSITVEAEKKSEPESFTYTEKADYEAIDVFNIPPSVTEIGVFEDDICVGAVVVEDTCAQILVYSDNANRNPIPFTFEVVTGRGFSSPIKDYQVLNLQTGEYETKSIFSNRQEYSVMRFSDEEELEDNIPLTPQLHGNYPNPFNPTTIISFSLPEEQEIDLTIYNIKGQKVKRLIDGQLTAGQHSMIWAGKDTNGRSVSTGIYFYRLKTGKKEISRKMLLLK